MNEIRLEKEEHNYIVSQTLALLRQRVVGNINTIHVEHVDQEFLALTKRDVGKSFPKIRKTDTPEERRRKANQGPESYDTMSVTSALQETVHKLLTKTRPHVPNATVSSAKMILMGHEVLRFLRQQRKKNIVLPHRLAQIITDQMDGIENDISLLSSRLEQKLESRDSCPENERTALSQEIDNLLREIQILNDKISEMHASFNCSSLILSEEGEEDEPNYNNDGDENGGIGLIDQDEPDILTYEEDMRMSPNEAHLIGYIPHDIRESDSITQDTFYWSTEGEEWQRSSFHIRDFPYQYKKMLEIILLRKRIIAFYAERTLETEEKRREKKKIYSGPGLGKIRKYLPELQEEIATLIQKISSIMMPSAGEDTVETLSEPEAIQEQLESNLRFLHERFDLNLINYIKIPANRAQGIRELEKIQQETSKTYKDIIFHCQRHGLQSQYISGEDAPSNEPPLDRSIVPTVEDYLEHPDFFENFPDVLLVQKSDAEKNLEVLCELQNADESLLPDVIESDILSFIYREEDGTESTTLQKMEALEGALQILQRRKMITYFHAHRFEKTHPNEEIQYHLNILKHEIEHMQSCINMITSRIDWEDNENAEPGRDLYREIEELGQRRFHFLEAFVEAADHRERALIGQKILTLCHALEKRRNALADITNNPRPENSIPAPPMGRHEVYCLRYILPDIRHSERHLFGKKIPYSIDSGKSARENKQETLKLEWSFVTERRMLLYFFMMNRLTEIDILIMDTSDDEESEQLIQERTELEGYTGIYYREITEGIRCLVQEKIEKDEVPPKKLHYQDLYNEAMKILGELDGAEASVEDNEHAVLIRSFWIKIQRQVLRFSDRIVIEEKKGHLHIIPEIQKEFDEEVRLIIHDIEIYLSRILSKNGYKGNAPDVLLAKAKRVRIQIFGGQ